MSDRNDLNKKAYDKVAEEYGKRLPAFSGNNRSVIETFVGFIDKKYPGKSHSNLSILDIGVGSGLDLSIFGELGFQLSGNEISEKMVEVAKGNVPEAQFFTGDFMVYEFPQKYNGVFAQAFIHLFPKSEVGKVFEKMFSLLLPNGLVHFSTTIHEESKEGWEKKYDYTTKVKRFRKRWQLEELNQFLNEIGANVVHQYQVKDPIGKTWVNTILSEK